MTFEYFCPRCGRKTDYAEERKGLCEQCYREVYGNQMNLPENVSVVLTRCKVCGRVFFDKKWLMPVRKKMSIIISSLIRKQNRKLRPFKFKILLDDKLSDIIAQHIIVNGEVLDKNGKSLGKIGVKIKSQDVICPYCRLKMLGEYWIYVIQIRAHERLLDEKKILHFINEIMLPDGEYIDVKRVKNGLDIKFTNKKVGEKVLQILSKYFGVKPKRYLRRKKQKALEKSIQIENIILNV